MDNSDTVEKRALLDWLDRGRAHVMEQFGALPTDARRRSYVSSRWTPRGLVRHLTLDVERVWFRAVMAGEGVELPEGYAGWEAHVIGETATHAGHLDVCRELADGGQRLVLDKPSTR